MNTRPIRLLIAALCLSLAGAFCLSNLTGCSTPPSERVTQVQTLKAVGTTAKAAMDATTDLLKKGTITYAQWEKVAAFFDNRFQPAFRLAVVAVNSDLSSVASPDILSLALELNALVGQLTAH